MEFQCKLVVVDFAYVDDTVELRCHALYVAFHQLQNRRFFLVGFVFQQGVEGGLHQRQRRADFVREVGEHLQAHFLFVVFLLLLTECEAVFHHGVYRHQYGNDYGCVYDVRPPRIVPRRQYDDVDAPCDRVLFVVGEVCFDFQFVTAFWDVGERY